MLITEFLVLRELAALYVSGAIKRSFAIATYALCGFASFPGIGIQIWFHDPREEVKNCTNCSLGHAGRMLGVIPQCLHFRSLAATKILLAGIDFHFLVLKTFGQCPILFKEKTYEINIYWHSG